MAHALGRSFLFFLKWIFRKHQPQGKRVTCKLGLKYFLPSFLTLLASIVKTFSSVKRHNQDLSSTKEPEKPAKTQAKTRKTSNNTSKNQKNKQQHKQKPEKPATTQAKTRKPSNNTSKNQKTQQQHKQKPEKPAKTEAKSFGALRLCS